MKRRVIVYCVMFFILQLLKALLLSDYANDYGKSRMEISLGEGSALGYNEVDSSEAYLTYHPTLISRIQNAGEVGGKSIQIIGTNDVYRQLENMQLVDGAFFGNEAMNEKRNVAVISDELSNALFHSNKGVYNTVNLQGKDYLIVGVYKKYSRIRDFILDDGYEKVFVPITSTLMKDKKIEAVCIDGTYIEEMPKEQDLQKMQLGTDLKSDQSKWFKEYTTIGQIPMMVLWIAVIVIGLKYIYQEGIACFRRTRQESRRKEKCKYILLTMGKTILVLGFIGLVSKLTFGQVYINASKLPEENIFDFMFYWKALKTEWIRHNQFIKLNLTHFEQATYLLKLILHSINIVQYMVLVKMEKIRYCKYKYENKPKKIAN